jgi:hypothetical protein
LEESCRRFSGSGTGDEGELWERASGGFIRGWYLARLHCSFYRGLDRCFWPLRPARLELFS